MPQPETPAPPAPAPAPVGPEMPARVARGVLRGIEYDHRAPAPDADGQMQSALADFFIGHAITGGHGPDLCRMLARDLADQWPRRATLAAARPGANALHTPPRDLSEERAGVCAAHYAHVVGTPPSPPATLTTSGDTDPVWMPAPDADGAAGVVPEAEALVEELCRTAFRHGAYGDEVATRADVDVAQGRVRQTLRALRARLAEADRDTERAHREARIAMDRRDEAEGRAAAAVQRAEDAASALRVAAAVFEEYAKLHRAKRTREGDMKADTNKDRALACWEAAARAAVPEGGEGGDDAK